MENLAWSEDYLTGFAEIDRQHQKLFSFVQRLIDAFNEKESKEVELPIIEEMMNYVREHFTCEEHYMETYGYKNFNEHKAQHEEFILKTFSFINDFIAERKNMSQQMIEYLANWIKSHIMITDMKYKTFFSSQGL